MGNLLKISNLEKNTFCKFRLVHTLYMYDFHFNVECPLSYNTWEQWFSIFKGLITFIRCRSKKNQNGIIKKMKNVFLLKIFFHLNSNMKLYEKPLEFCAY